MCLFPCSVLYCSGTLRQMVDSSYCNKRCCVGSRVDLPYNTVFHFVPQPDGVVSFHFNFFFIKPPIYSSMSDRIAEVRYLVMRRLGQSVMHSSTAGHARAPKTKTNHSFPDSHRPTKLI